MPATDPSPEKTRRRLLVSAWGLLAIGLTLCLTGMREGQNQVPSDFGSHMGNIPLEGIEWIIVGMIFAALSMMCFLAQWVMRRK